MIHFLAKSINNSFNYNTNEIMAMEWIEIDEIKKMKENEFRSFPVVKFIIESLERTELYNIDIIKNLQVE